MHTVNTTQESTSSTRLQSETATSSSGLTKIRVKGKSLSVQTVQIGGRTVIAAGRWLKIAVVQDEELVEGETVKDPESFLSQLRASGLNADIFTFGQKLPDTHPKYAYHFEWDNVAAIPITTFSEWLQERTKPDVRAAVRKAAKAGIVVKRAGFDDEFVEGIASIYNETPFRQGKPFWHFGKTSDVIKSMNSTYPERNVFLGAYYENKLIGFVRLICVKETAVLMQLLSKVKYSNKKPNNALMARAVELCEQSGIRYLTYGKYIYNDSKSSLTEFKRRNGFEQVLLPRYFISLTRKGKIALRLGLHGELSRRIPESLLRQLLRIRSLWYTFRRKQLIPNLP